MWLLLYILPQDAQLLFLQDVNIEWMQQKIFSFQEVYKVKSLLPRLPFYKQIQ